MPQPPEYQRLFSFTGYQTANPSKPLPADKLDGELNRVKQTSDAVRANLKQIQRDDGALANESVGVEQIKPELNFGLNAVTTWMTGVDYKTNDGVFTSGKLYRATEAHTSTTFSTDLSAGKWQELVDYNNIPGVSTPTIQAGDANLPISVNSGESDYELKVLPIAGGGTGGATASTARSGLGLGTAAVQADTRYNHRSNNLSDVANAATARGNLGLGTAAVQADTRYNHRSNNLSDVANAVTARGNLGLGTAATKDTSDIGPLMGVTSINGGQLAGFRNWIINGNFTINQRGTSTKAQADGTYGYDRWKGVADIGGNTDTLEQVIESLPAGEYTLSWSGGGDGSLAGGAAAASPITATVTAGNTSVKVPATATEVQVERGPVATPFEYRPVGVELALCQRYYTVLENLVFRAYGTTGKWPTDNVSYPVTMRAIPSVNVASASVSSNAGGSRSFNAYKTGGYWIMEPSFDGMVYFEIPYIRLDAEL